MNISNEKNISTFLKKLNTISSIKELSQFVSAEMLKLTGAGASCFCLMSNITNKIYVKQFAFSPSQKNNSQTIQWIEKVARVGVDLLTNKYDNDDIITYFNSMTKPRLLVEPIFCKNIILGFVAVVNRHKKFNENKLTIFDILMESINSRVELLYLRDELDRTNREKIQFLASISHEYKTPLNSIIGFSDMLKAELVGSSNFKYVDNISKSSKFLLSLIQDILDMARSEYKPMELKYETFQPMEVIKDIIYSFDEVIKERKVDFSYTLMDVELTADLKRFKQLIYNLMSNALKFNKPGGKITIVAYTDEKQNYVFEIKDSGDGIRKKDYEKIFNFFSQVNRDKLKRQQGSGVGLALCKAIATAHHGDIGFKSRLNAGSTFWFSLPQNGYYEDYETDVYY